MYHSSLAEIHNSGFGFYARAAAREIHNRLPEKSVKPKHILELGCGSALFAVELGIQDMDLHYTGVDISVPMIELAEKNLAGKSVDLVVGSIYDTELPEMDLTVAVGEIVAYSDPAEVSRGDSYFEERLLSLFQKIQQSLRPGGWFMFDTVLPKDAESMSSRSFYDNSTWSIMVETKRVGNFLNRCMITYKVEPDGRFQRDSESHHLYLYEAEKIEGWLQAAGFTFERLSRYADFELAPARVGYLCSIA